MSTVDAGVASPAATRGALFTADTAAATVLEAHRHLGRQPARPLLEAQWPRAVPWAAGFAVPVLAVAAAQDRLVPAGVAARTARYHGGEHLTLGGAGRALMLDDRWRDAAGGIARRLGALPRPHA